jgi:hypothetical protein
MGLDTLQWRCNASWLYIFRLDGQYSGPEEYFRILFQFGFNYDLLVSRKQGSIAQSTAEAEYIAASAASREAAWLRKLLSDLFSAELEPTVIHCDNQSCVKLFVIPVFS